MASGTSIQARALREFSTFGAASAVVIAVCMFAIGFMGAKKEFVALSVIGAELMGFALFTTEGVLIGTVLGKRPFLVLVLITGLVGSATLMAVLENHNTKATASGFFVWQGIVAITAATKVASITHELVASRALATLCYGSMFVGVAVFLPTDSFTAIFRAALFPLLIAVGFIGARKARSGRGE